jgi:hypothetical protein
MGKAKADFIIEECSVIVRSAMGYRLSQSCKQIAIDWLPRSVIELACDATYLLSALCEDYEHTARRIHILVRPADWVVTIGHKSLGERWTCPLVKDLQELPWPLDVQEIVKELIAIFSKVDPLQFLQS